MSVQQSVSIKELNTLAVDCEVGHLYTTTDVAQLCDALKACAQRGEAPLVLGSGSNVVLKGSRLQSCVLVRSKGIERVSEDSASVCLKVAAGEIWDELVAHTIKQGFYGLENLSWIPGSVGAAPVQNIGAYGVELSQFVQQLEYLDSQDYQLKVLDNKGCKFAYRDSVFKHQLKGRAVIVSVTLRLAKQFTKVTDYKGLDSALLEQTRTRECGAGADITASRVRGVVIAMRQAKLPDPEQLANVGSFFKNPIISEAELSLLQERYAGLVFYPTQQKGQVKLAAAWLIDKAGWRGFSDGKVGVHSQQALVLVNEGEATGADILALASKIMRSVFEKFSVRLEIEPRIIAQEQQ